MKPLFAALAAATIALGLTFAPASARESYVIDNAHLLSAASVSTINAKIADFNALSHKEIVVVIEPAVTSPPREASEQLYAQLRVNGVMIFIAKSPKTIAIIPDNAAQKFFPSGTTGAIRQAIASAFNTGDFNGGVNNGVDLVLAQYRSHLSAVRTTSVSVAQPVVPAMVHTQTGGFNMSVIWWLIALAVIFFIVRGVFRAMAGPRMMPPGYGGPSGPMGGYPPGYGGGGYPGYGPGYGGGGGGGFWSGMLGGLGGAFLGNELFGGHRTEIFEQNPGMSAGMNGGEYGGQNQGGGDASGFQSDPGQADMGNSSVGGWGGSDSGGGWGDTGGGGGGDWGGGSDSGGGW